MKFPLLCHFEFPQENVVYVPAVPDDALDVDNPGENDDYEYGWERPPSPDMQVDDQVTYL
jgi:hypothetical protein